MTPLDRREPLGRSIRAFGRLALAGLIAFGGVAAARAGEPGLLVAMHDTGRVERYDPKTGAHQATLVSGLTAPNVVAEGPDGRLYVSTGAPGGPGAVLRFDARTGRRLDTFVAVPPGQPGHLARATGLAWHDGDLLVASQGDGKVHRYDGKTGGWKATSPPPRPAASPRSPSGTAGCT
jgi:sugar lactone lactonase YvrE